MAETSGFFDAQLIDGEYDRVYYAEQFANYFKQLVGNGVFANPVNQLKVVAGTGMNVIVYPGWAFINGFWYHNDEQKVIPINPNTGSLPRVDSVKVRYSNATRKIDVDVYEGDVSVTKTEGRYELKLAEVSVPSFSGTISNSNITDTRMDENVCGFVKGLVEVVDTDDLFLQYTSIFNDWFDSVKAIVTSTRYEQLLNDVDNIKDGTLSVPNAQNAVNSEGAAEAVHSINADEATHALNADNATNADNANHSVASSSCDNDFILLNQETLSFVNKVCTLSDSRITSDSLADVYFTADTEITAQKAKISVDTYNGRVEIVADRQPESIIKASVRIRVV